MAVKDGVSYDIIHPSSMHIVILTPHQYRYYPTSNLISKKPRKHYRIPVRSQHWQLRSLISAEKQNIIYFPGGSGSNHVQRLNTTTKECETVKFLSFSPRCLVAESGWICCGGETGEFTAIQLESTADDGNDLDLQLNLEPDARLPLGFDSDSLRPEDTVFSLVAQSRRLNMSSRLNKSYTAKSQKLARDRVNCITMWFPPIAGPMHHGAYTEPAAVLANNDKTVVLVSLRDFEGQDKVEPLDVVTYPDYVNRAVISPDGRLLVAILDDPFLYIHHRVETTIDENGPFREDDKAEHRWELCGKILLKSQRRDDGSDSRVLDISAEGDYEHVTVLDRATIDPRLLEGRGERETASPSPFAAPLGIGESRRRRGSEGPERHHLALTPDETRVLEALQDERRRREQRDRIAARMAEQAARERSDFQPGSVSRAIGDLLGNIRDSRERAQERIRNAHRLILQSSPDRERMLGMMNAHPPRRSASIRPGDSSAAAQRTANDLRSLTPSGSGWADLEAVYSLSFESNIQDLRTATRDRDRDRSSILPLLNSVAIRELEERNARRRVVLEHGVHEAPPEPDNTAGISWSEDGRIL
ncbi:hypothetical protein COL922a_006113 [Colletotrichum nupharicola]|nr:hypothetical protein COL922a_006113 [Colletotrichum nupharicola]